MGSKIIYELTKTDLEEVLSNQLNNILHDKLFSRYQDRLISVNCVAEIHGITRDTVVKYANANLIPYEKKGNLYKFSLAEILQVDFHKLKTRRRYN